MRRRRRSRRGWRAWSIATALLLVLCGGFWLGVRGPDNLHAVADGMVYRSAQMDAATLRHTIREKGIKAILNLRGEKPGSNWYRKEMEAAQAADVLLLNHGLSAQREVSPDELEDVLRLMDRAPKPLLVHCEGGSDRTGLVIAAWVFSRGHRPTEEAYKQLSLRYGHFPYLWSNTDAMDKSFWNYVRQAAGTPR
ncbi:Dual specificity phosphatase, catalytic domain [Humidesulfovibrio mexicanus]|uniref:Dual specificity phosphatase, catalytic domain n=1 Tax=Humidesulfovibrio mexicanus TaxID=147047 RepID=A0A239CG05_9BACT|nr:tyrosine-protein phosphatase [Humidesulfovibrio mexicanus]SNS19145.1 Dual specificity phosphatase, catalytic domain [Humidesulfovibrio mexicanus]